MWPNVQSSSPMSNVDFFSILCDKLAKIFYMSIPCHTILSYNIKPYIKHSTTVLPENWTRDLETCSTALWQLGYINWWPWCESSQTPNFSNLWLIFVSVRDIYNFCIESVYHKGLLSREYNYCCLTVYRNILIIITNMQIYLKYIKVNSKTTVVKLITQSIICSSSLQCAHTYYWLKVIAVLPKKYWNLIFAGLKFSGREISVCPVKRTARKKKIL